MLKLLYRMKDSTTQPNVLFQCKMHTLSTDKPIYFHEFVRILLFTRLHFTRKETIHFSHSFVSRLTFSLNIHGSWLMPLFSWANILDNKRRQTFSFDDKFLERKFAQQNIFLCTLSSYFTRLHLLPSSLSLFALQQTNMILFLDFPFFNFFLSAHE